MNLNVFCFLLLSAIGGTFSAAIPKIGSQLPGIVGTTGSGLGGLLGGGGSGNVLGSLPDLSSVVKTVGGLGQGIDKTVAQKSIQNPVEQVGVKSLNPLPGIGNGIGGTSGGGLGGLLGGGGTGNVLGSLPDLNSVMKTAGGLGQGIENAVGKKLIETAAEQGLKTMHQYENRVLKTIEDFFGGLFNTGEKGGEKGLFPKTAENSLKTIQGVGNGLLGQAEKAIEQISGGIGGGIVPKIGG
ncbi:glycine-rich cell wall structural protein-like [Belonocnema kinseyi]|uniref:glycine-rich cell wall structural protein-like n=1 Tax=Belonocnema kinseyi TaxID=2817044 RepID=UPI00143D9263|nr:glycine-rich cell wall structural protein-like [Belonocnema kinseyi]